MAPVEQPNPALMALAQHAYARGRKDFVEATIKALSEPALQGISLTSIQVADMLRQASEKCDQMVPGKSLTN